VQERALSRPVTVLAGVLHVGEPSLPSTLAALRAQVDIDLELLLIGHEPKQQAHQRLYESFSALTEQFDVLVKVDADMQIVEPALLRTIGWMFRRHRHLDRIQLGVDDWFSGARIPGMHAWRSGTTWTTAAPELFTDAVSNTAKGKLTVMDAGRTLVLHGAAPDDAQALRYGAHRALKAELSHSTEGADARWGWLMRLQEHAIAHPHRSRRLALAAAEAALTDPALGRRCVDAADALLEADRLLLTRLADDPELPHRLAEVLAERRRLSSAVDEPTALAIRSAPSEHPPVHRRPRPVWLRRPSWLRRTPPHRRLDKRALRAEFLALLER
jgi:hypothetical protein